jgi:hypothetical protein
MGLFHVWIFSYVANLVFRTTKLQIMHYTKAKSLSKLVTYETVNETRTPA